MTSLKQPFPVHKSRQLNATHGYCRACRIMHSLAQEPAIPHCLSLMEKFTTDGTIALCRESCADSLLSTDYLFGEARGKMFGVLTGKDNSGKQHTLYAFSGQYNGLWEVPGWAPPLFDLEEFHNVHDRQEREIKTLSHELNHLDRTTDSWKKLFDKRKHLSQQLMKKIFSIYSLKNFRGQTASLQDAFNKKGIPTGTGDCCAPKLLVQAASLDITPIGMAEFYWGKENKSGTRHHGRFYHCCVEKCQPLLGFLLCGVNNHAKNSKNNET